MKCLFVIPRMGGGGAERVLANQANTMAQQGHDITILTIVGGDSFYPLDEKVKYISANVSVKRNNKVVLFLSESIGLIKSFVCFRKMIKKIDPNFVFSQQRQADIICYLVKKSGVHFKHVCYEINDPFVRRRLVQKILRRIFNDSELLVCQSENVKKYYDTVPRSCVIPNPINPNVIPKRVLPSRPRIVAVGRLDKQKNFSMLLNAFVLVLKEYPDCCLDIYGEGPLRNALQKQIDSLHIQKKAVLRGAHSDVLECICDASVFVMSSDYEGMPNALLEAMAIGLPVVSTDFKTGVARELIGSNNGIVVPVNNPEALANASIKILSNKNIIQVAAIENRSKMRDFYNDVIMKKWIKAFEEIC